MDERLKKIKEILGDHNIGRTQKFEDIIDIKLNSEIDLIIAIVLTMIITGI